MPFIVDTEGRDFLNFLTQLTAPFPDHCLLFTDFRCQFCKGSLMKVHYPKLYNMAHLLSLNVFTASKESNNYILFAITAAGVVPCGGPKKSPRTSSIVQIIFFF